MGFRIRLTPSQLSFDIAADENVVAAAHRQGLMLPHSCRDGECGTCRARILEGRVSYPQGRPMLLDDPHNKGYALLCQAQAQSDLRLEVDALPAAAELPPRRLPCRVERAERIAHDVLRLTLRPPAAQPLNFHAGQYVDFLLKDGRRRSFSIANAPREDGLLELQVRYVRGGEFTDYLFNELGEKAVLRIEGPFGTFFWREHGARPAILLAGGTGFAPIKAMMEQLLNADTGREVHLYWGARARRDLYMDELPRRWMDSLAKFRYTPVLSEPRPDDAWQGRTGLVHEAVAADYPDLAGHDVYASGPPRMVHGAFALFSDHGLPASQYYADAFDYAPDSRARRVG